MNIKKITLSVALLFGACSMSFADGTKEEPEIDYKYRFGVDFQIKLAKGLKLDLEPEFRFNEGFDKLLLNAGVSYKTFGCIYWGATYRFELDRGDSVSSTGSMNGFGTTSYEKDVYHRYALDVTYKEKFGRFTPSFRVRYNNFTDNEITDKAFMRYRAKVDYDIRKSRFTPYVAIELFQELGENLLYKTRYATGFDLKTGKKSTLCLDYKFDLFALEYKNANIFSVGYKFKF